MIRRVLLVLFALLLLVPGLTASAVGPPTFSLPEHASEVAPGVFFLGFAVQDGIALVGYAYARDATVTEQGRRANAKPPWAGGGGGGPGGGGGGEDDPDPTSESCYSYIARGAHWNTPESYLFNASNGPVDDSALAGADGAFTTWETAAGTSIVNPGETTDDELVADTSGTDGKNEIYFASMTGNTLGYTIVWSTRARGRNPGQIVESDMVIDPDWNWYTGDPDKIGLSQMDFWGVFAHEAGHWIGLGHTDATALCSQQTMYPSISDNDSSKRTLGDGDEAGALALYN